MSEEIIMSGLGQEIPKPNQPDTLTPADVGLGEYPHEQSNSIIEKAKGLAEILKKQPGERNEENIKAMVGAMPGLGKGANPEDLLRLMQVGGLSPEEMEVAGRSLAAAPTATPSAEGEDLIPGPTPQEEKEQADLVLEGTNIVKEAKKAADSKDEEAWTGVEGSWREWSAKAGKFIGITSIIAIFTFYIAIILAFRAVGRGKQQ